MTSKDRIENAIRHIQTATDIDPWAMEIAVDAMQRMLDVDGDLVSRREGINTLCEICDRSKHPDWVYTDEFCRALGALPSAQPERKTGHWVEAEEDWRHQLVWWKCSGCGSDVSTMYKYCPYCGAEMRGEENG